MRRDTAGPQKLRRVCWQCGLQCRLPEEARKGKRGVQEYRKSFQKGTQICQNGTLEAPGRLLGARSEEGPSKCQFYPPHPPLEYFFELGAEFCGTNFSDVFWISSENDFFRFWSPKGVQNGGFWSSIWRLFLKTRKV